jgi:peroxiredoxin Q/BCP
VSLADPIHDRMSVFGVLTGHRTAWHKEHIRAGHIGKGRVDAQVHEGVRILSRLVCRKRPAQTTLPVFNVLPFAPMTELSEACVAQSFPRYSLPMIAGDKAPDFTLYDHTGWPRTLSALLSEGPVVLFFFPIASSPICTAQACHFRDLRSEFAAVGAQRVGISTDTVDKQAHFAQQRSFDYPLLSDADGVVSAMFGVRRGRLAKLHSSVVARDAARRSRHSRRRGLLARLLPVRRTTFVIDTDRTVLKVVSSELRASVHADQTLAFLQNVREKHTDVHQQSEGEGEPIGDWFSEPEPTHVPNLVRPYALTRGRTYSGVELALEALVEVPNTTAKPPRWPRNDVRGQILTLCVHSPSVAEIAARLSLPLGVTRVLVGDLVKQGYLRVHATLDDSVTIDERRELTRRTLQGLRAL